MKLFAAKCRQTLICSLVIALSATVISTVHSTSLADGQQPHSQPAAAAAPASESKPTDVADVQAPKAAAPEASATAASKPEASKSEVAEDASARRGRSEPPPSSVSEKPPAAVDTKTDDKKTGASSKAAESKTSAPSKQPASSSNKAQLGGKSGASTNRKLPANLGTVTSTGSGGPAHYMSKHDAYSAIAEKHGALAQDAMRKADKRQTSHLQQRFGGIHKASGFGDMMSPFKGVTDSGLARTLGASMRSIMKSKYSVPAYLASAVLGAVALMAFYESPISPLPVPPLPEPPVGRFPPEMPNISPNLQVPFRMNQQNQGQYGQSYQRSFQAGAGAQPGQAQQVLFPGAAAQQRQMGAGGPVQQFAANLISSVGTNKQAAQRKSGLDYDASSSRSFFGLSGAQPAQHQPAASGKLGSSTGAQTHKGGAMSSMLSFFGLGGGDSSPVSGLVGASGLSGHQIAAGGGPISAASGSEQKGQAALSNSHLVNKMKSYFDRPAGPGAMMASQSSANHYDQYRRMSIVQALAKDTAFLSSFFTPSRRSSNATSQIQQSISNVLAAATGANPAAANAQSANLQMQQQAAARMQVEHSAPLLGAYGLRQPQQQQQHQQPSVPLVNTKRASSGYGLMRAADRIGHALLETFTSGLLHRNSQADVGAATKSDEQQQQQQNALASATSLLTDIMASYSSQQNAAGQQQASSEQQANKPHQQQLQAASDDAAKSQHQSNEHAQGRSLEQAASASVPPEQQQQQVAPKSQSQQSASQAESSAASSAVQQAPLVRKTRSIGYEYSVEPLTQPQQPSRATQINNLVDMVSNQYKQNKLLFSFVMNQVGLSHALPYVDQFLGTPNELKDQ